MSSRSPLPVPRHQPPAARHLPALAALALAAILFGGSKPSPGPQPKLELVIIVEPISDGLYSTRMLHITKDQANELHNQD